MKSSILGFDQMEVLKLRKDVSCKNGSVKTIAIDVTDLLILTVVADIVHRDKFVKYIVNDKMYYSIRYSAILEDLPILSLKKQALADRLDKLSTFNLIEKITMRNEIGTYTLFRIGEGYSVLKYTGVCSGIQGGVVSKYAPKDYITNNTITTNTNNNNNISPELNSDTRLGSAEPLKTKKTNTPPQKAKTPPDNRAERFESLWILYQRKGSKKKAREQFMRLKPHEIDDMAKHIGAYMSANEIQYRKDLERYISYRTWESAIIPNKDKPQQEQQTSNRYQKL